MKIEKIEWKPQGSLGEAVSTKVEMALIDDAGKGLCVPVRCKDFLTDAYYGEHHGKEVGMYGFRWKPGTFSKNEPIRISIRKKGTKLTAVNAKTIAGLLEPFDKALGGSKVLVDVDTVGNLYAMVGPEWTTAPWQISLLTLLLRIGVDMEPEEGIVPFLDRIVKDNNDAGDGRWLKGCLPALHSMLEGKIPEKLAGITYASYKTCGEAHHSGGIYAAFSGKSTG